MIDHALDFIILALASFRLTRLIVFDKITAFLRKPFFEEIEEKNEAGEVEIYIVPKKTGLKSWIGELLSCYWCTGIWVAIFIVLTYSFIPVWFGIVIVILAVSGLAALIELVVQRFISE